MHHYLDMDGREKCSVGRIFWCQGRVCLKETYLCWPKKKLISILLYGTLFLKHKQKNPDSAKMFLVPRSMTVQAINLKIYRYIVFPWWYIIFIKPYGQYVHSVPNPFFELLCKKKENLH